MSSLTKIIESNNWFLKRGDKIDNGDVYKVDYHKDQPFRVFSSPPTFMIEFNNVKAHTLPLLHTEDNEIISDHIWPILSKFKAKPYKHGLWSMPWNQKNRSHIDLKIPEVSKTFNEQDTYVWLPIDKESAGNPWHIWIDLISKFRLIEKRYGRSWQSIVPILPNRSAYFDKVAKHCFPNLKYYVMPRGETWAFKHLLVPSMSNAHDGITNADMVRWLRHKFSPKIKVKPFRKLWISRKNAVARHIQNEQALFMKLKGWEFVQLEKLPIGKQMQIFAEAKSIIAPHGAGLTNLLWCQSGTRILEFQRDTMLGKKVYPVLAHHLDLPFTTRCPDIKEEELIDGKKPPGVKRLNDLFKFDLQWTYLKNSMEEAGIKE
jgi:hypothetical protein